MSESQYQSLSCEIRDALAPYRYAETEVTDQDSVVALFVTPRRWMCRYACSLVRVPIHVTTLTECKAFVETIREGLASRYGQWPWMKEIGTYLVLLCSPPLYKVLLGHEAEFKDNTGLHVNVMLGTCFVNVDTHDSSSESTWGLYYSGRHFTAICKAVNQWRSQDKKA